MKVGFIDYLNAFPLNAAFRNGVLKSDCELFYQNPVQSNQMLREGRLDISQVSSVEYLDGGHLLLPGFGVSARSKILTVNLYVKNAPSSLQDARIGLTQQSATSIALLKVLFHHLWKCSPRFETLDRSVPLAAYEGFLLIGDEALEAQTIPGFKTIDLAQTWVEWTGLPFVFAVFAVRKDVWETKKPQIENFQKKLQASLNWAENNPEEILKLAQKRSDVPLPLIKEYYALCHYRLGKQEMEGLALFQQMRESCKDVYELSKIGT